MFTYAISACCTAHYYILKKPAFIMVVLAVLSVPVSVWGGNPIVTPAGVLLLWPTPEITYQIDKGPLGPYSETIARNLVIKAFEQWSEVEYCRLKCLYGGSLKTDITADNAASFLNQMDDGLNPILFDSDGSIIDLLRGKGASDDLLGLSNPIATNTGTILKSQAVINGKKLTGWFGESNTLFSTMLHEFGHFLGLGHSQLLQDFAFDGFPANNVFLPVMFPVEPNGRISPNQLSQDDKMTLANLYPTQEFFTERGGIKGTVTRPTLEAVQGANVVTVNVSEPLVYTYSVVSDLFIRQTGEFTFRGLPPGLYEVHIEPINPKFVDVSGVGPFTDRPDSPSFINPVKKEYYNGNRESGVIGQDNPDDRVVLSVGKGDMVSDINFVANELPVSVQDWSIY